FRGVRGHQREKCAEGLARERDTPIALAFELTHVIDKPPAAGGQRIGFAGSIETEHIPSRIAQDAQIRRRWRLGVLDIDRTAMIPDDYACSARRTEQLLVKSRIEANFGRGSTAKEYKTEDKRPQPDRKTLPHSGCPLPLALSPSAG